MREIVDSILSNAYELGASDIHIVAGLEPVLRIHGELKKTGDVLSQEEVEGIVSSLMGQELVNTLKDKGQVDCAYEIENVSRFRVNAYKRQGMYSIALRTISTKIPTMEDLKMPSILKEIAKKPQGLFLVTGPTGSGKSTTLASMIDYLNKTTEKHIITLEEPVEYIYTHDKSVINQREVGFDTGSFSEGLRASLRQDPDVILVGELRDLETITTAITAAETGHLVFATLHTRSASATIDRIIDVFPHGQQDQIRIQLAGSLLGVLSQRLLRTGDGKGRVACTELMLNNTAISNLIRSEKVHQINNIIQTSRQKGMYTMDTDIEKLLREGKISKETAETQLQKGDM